MRPRPALQRALRLLLAVSALLPAFAPGQAMACGTAPDAARTCCCEQPAPAAPLCHGGAGDGTATSACGCGSQPAPVTPAERASGASQGPSTLAALPAPIAVAAHAAPAASIRTVPADAPRAGGCALLRLHCVILI